jgi:3-oxoacyl-[acyl-carrier-protein] synthase II
MKVYIRSAGNISPQHSLDTDQFFANQVTATANYFKSQEPDYDKFVDSKMIRRMSRIVKMGVASAMTCLQNAGVEQPGAILTATAYGCLEDTSSFLRRMIEFEEKMLSPTAFIQSTHNTVGAQIALLLKCHNYNNTIVHRAFSFENALMEVQLLLSEQIAPVLVGAIDEITNDRHAILSRFGLYRGGRHVAGEGAAFFLLDNEPGNNPLAILRSVRTLYDPQQNDLNESVEELLKDGGISPGDLGLILSSNSGNDSALPSALQSVPIFNFESLCGNYPTSSGFALWLGSLLLKEQKAPVWMDAFQFPMRNILIHHHPDDQHHSFILISAL